MIRNRPHLLANRIACLAVIAALLAPAPLFAQKSILKIDRSVVAAFRDVVARPNQSTVRILCDEKEVALGTVVGEDGWIVTKASELKGKVTVRLRDGKVRDAVIQGVEEKYDLAMLKIALVGLKPIEWAPSKSAEVGDWLASAGPGDGPVAIGVVSVAAREPKMFEMPQVAPKANSGYMGIQLGDDDNGAPTIGRVEPNSAALKAGMKVGDIVVAVQGKPVTDIETLIATIQGFKAGETVKIKIKRDGKERELSVTLGKRPAGQPNRGDIQNNMGSTLSARRGGFPAIMQSDLVIKPTDCGGPWVTLDGKAVGLCIARAGRTESYAIPSERVQALLSDLKSGRLKPKEPDPVVKTKGLEEALDKAKAALLAKQRDLRAAEEEDDADKVQKLEEEVSTLKKKVADAQKALDDARKDSTKKEKERADK